jgi:hypothetical protein
MIGRREGSRDLRGSDDEVVFMFQAFFSAAFQAGTEFERRSDEFGQKESRYFSAEDVYRDGRCFWRTDSQPIGAN